jgi:glutamyl-tRNA synthetase/nondiscriminating glutamyl-tRNA synthetase
VGLLAPIFDSNVGAWADKLIDLLAPYVDRLDQLPDKAGIIFRYDAAAALADPGNALLDEWATVGDVLAAFAQRVADEDYLPTAEHFKVIMSQIKTETGVKGKELFHPVRIMLIGAHSGPDFDKLIPLIEEGSKLELPVHVKSVRERVREFMDAFERRKK